MQEYFRRYVAEDVFLVERPNANRQHAQSEYPANDIDTKNRVLQKAGNFRSIATISLHYSIWHGCGAVDAMTVVAQLLKNRRNGAPLATLKLIFVIANFFVFFFSCVCVLRDWIKLVIIDSVDERAMRNV